MTRLERVRSSRTFTTIVVTIAVFTDTLLYSLVASPSSAAGGFHVSDQAHSGDSSVAVNPRTRARVSSQHVQTWISVLLAIFGGAQLAAPLFVGPYTDRCKSKQQPFTLGLVVLGAATLMFFMGTHIALLAVARALQGVSTTLVWTSGMTVLSARAGPEHTGSAMGLVMAGATCGELTGPAVGGLLYEYSGEIGVASIAAAFIVVDIALRLLLLEPRAQSVKTKEDNGETEALLSTSKLNDNNEAVETGNAPSNEQCSHSSSAVGNRNREDDVPSELQQDSNDPLHQRSDYAILLTNFDFLASLWAIWFSTVARTGLDATIPLFVQLRFDWSESKSGLALLIMVAPSLLAPIFGRLNNRFGPRWLTCMAFVAQALLYSALGFAQNGATTTRILFCLILFGIGATMFLITIAHMAAIPVVANEIGAKARGNGGKSPPSGKAFGMMTQAFAAGLLIDPVWAGELSEHSGWLPMCATFCGACVLSAVIMGLRWRKWAPS